MKMIDYDSPLILIVTYKCNMRCAYCPVQKISDTMKTETALKAVELYLKNFQGPHHIRFIGGEPLLVMELVREVVRYAGLHAATERRLKFDLTTNGMLLTSKLLDYFLDNEKFELIVSLDGPWETHSAQRTTKGKRDSFSWSKVLYSLPPHSKNIAANKVVSPGNVETLVDDFKFIYEMGLRRINIIPAYYVFWPDRAIAALKNNLDRLCDFISKLPQDKPVPIIKNTFQRGHFPLFNTGMVIDTDGIVYSSNHIMYRMLREKRMEAARTSVWNFDASTLLGRNEEDYVFISKYIDHRSLITNRIVDKILTSFVEQIIEKSNAPFLSQLTDT